MAKQPKSGGEGSGKIKFRVIEFEIDGSDTSLQESLKSLTAALRGASHHPTRARLVAPPADEQPSDDESPEAEEAEVLDADDGEPVTRATVRKPAAPKKLVQVKFLTDLKTDNVNPTLREFALSKAPDSEIGKHLVIAHWFKHHGGLEELSMDHFFTAYKHIGWSTPKDPTGPIRDARHKRRVFMTTGKAPGTVSLTYTGERLVDEMGKKA